MTFITDKLKRNNIIQRDGLMFAFVLIVGIASGVWIATGNWTATVILFSPILIYLCIEKPFILPFGLYVFLLPFDSVLVVTGGSAAGPTLTKLLGILSILVLMFKSIFEKKFKRPDNIALLWMLFLIYGALSFFWAIKPESVIGRMPTAAGLIILYLVTASYKIQKAEFDTLKKFIVSGGFFAAIYTIYNYSSITDMRVTMQMGEQSADPNHFAFSLIIPVSVCIQLMMEHKKKTVKALLGVVLGLISFAIIITGSRGGFLGVGIIIAVYILSMKHKVTFSTILIVIGIIVTSLLPDLFVERWSEAVGSGGAGRFSIWYVGWKSLGDYWSFGAGLSNFPSSYGEFAFHDLSKGWSRGAHNIYLEIIVELGIIGFSIMVLAIIKHYKAAKSRFSKYRMDEIMLKASFWAILLSSSFLGTVWRKSYWLLWILIIMYKTISDKEQNLSKQYER